jgi:hypothetical protein
MTVDPKTDRIGGTASLMFSVICAWFAWTDWQGGQSIWEVWAVMCVVLALNGMAMFVHASRTTAR